MAPKDPKGAVQLFEVVGRAPTRRSDADPAVVVEAGWGVPATVCAAVRLRASRPLRDAKIVVELRGFTDTKWVNGKPVERDGQTNTVGEPPVRLVKKFLQLVEVVKEKETLEPVEFGELTFPFKINLPKSGLPPSYSDKTSSITYHFKTTLSYQDGMRLLKTHREIETPVTVLMPEAARSRLLLSNQTPLVHQADPTDAKCGYAIHLPIRVVRPGEVVTADVELHSTPAGSKIRLISASLRSTKEYLGAENRAALVKFPRPLSEASENIGAAVPSRSQALTRRFTLIVDKDIAQPSLESPLISIKTFFRLEVVLDTSETPNVAIEVPLVVIPADAPQQQPVEPAFQMEASSHMLPPYPADLPHPNHSVAKTQHPVVRRSTTPPFPPQDYVYSQQNSGASPAVPDSPSTRSVPGFTSGTTQSPSSSGYSSMSSATYAQQQAILAQMAVQQQQQYVPPGPPLARSTSSGNALRVEFWAHWPESMELFIGVYQAGYQPQYDPYQQIDALYRGAPASSDELPPLTQAAPAAERLAARDIDPFSSPRSSPRRPTEVLTPARYMRGVAVDSGSISSGEAVGAAVPARGVAPASEVANPATTGSGSQGRSALSKMDALLSEIDNVHTTLETSTAAGVSS
ncbi:hypothetical protein HK405_007829, partial [Cladochytrium tenue]